MFKHQNRKNRSRNRVERLVRTGVLESLEGRRLLSVDGIEFEDLLPGSTYAVGDSFVADDTGFQADIHVDGFTRIDGSMNFNGIVQVHAETAAGGAGQDLFVNETTLDFQFTEPLQGLTFDFGEFGGNVNLDVNGDFRIVENFADLHGAVIGGADVSVTNGHGGDQGSVLISGAIEAFRVGGVELWIDNVCAVDEGEESPTYDYGDAPESYQTTSGNNGPFHFALDGVHLGANLDVEFDGQPNLNSDGDDLNGINDEDGVVFLDTLIPGQSAAIEVAASTQGWLNGWIDFDRSGTFDLDEKVVDGELLGVFPNTISIEVPTDAEPSNLGTHSRWRFSTNYQHLDPINNLEPGQFAPDGEVEDHLVFISEAPEPEPVFDFGDAPDTFGTTSANNGPFHLVVEGVHLGNRVDAELDGQPSDFAADDDLNGTGDEDGISFIERFYAGQQANAHITTSAQGWLNAWIDFNKDGVFQSTEKVIDGVSVSPLAPNIIPIDIPENATATLRGVETISRWRFSTNYQYLSPINDLEPNQFPPDGEVEDHAIYVYATNDPDPSCIDFEHFQDRFFIGTIGFADLFGLKADMEVEQKSTDINGNPAQGDSYAETGFAQKSGGTGRDIRVLRSLLDFDFPQSLAGVRLNFGEFGGNVNFEINGDFRNVENFNQLNGQLIGGVPVVVVGGNGNDTGILEIHGAVDSFKIGGQEIWIDRICEFQPEVAFFDYGDAPESYGTSKASNGPFHLASGGVHLGTRLDVEDDGQPDVNSEGDDADGSDDEDGVVFLDPLVVGQSARIQVDPSTQGWLNGWIDFDRNGSFSANEKVADGVSINGLANIITIDVPADAEPSGFGTHSRWRFSSNYQFLSPTNDLAANQFPPDGEVEDHLVFIEAEPEPDYLLDFGDAPDSYGTLLSSGGPAHLIGDGVYLGAGVDAEPDGMPSANADGDDLSGLDDEDGVNFLTQLVAGQSAVVEVTASTQGLLWASIDFDGNGQFDATEQLSQQSLNAGVNRLTINVPSTAVTNRTTFSRWSFASSSAVFIQDDGRAFLNGEVEDHPLVIEAAPTLDFGDAPSPYPTLIADNGAHHHVDPSVKLGDAIDAEFNGQPTHNADGDDLAGVPDDEDGVVFLNDLIPGQDGRIEVTASVDGWLNAWIDFDNNQKWDVAPSPDAIVVSRFINAGTNTLVFPVPANAQADGDTPTWARFRFTTDVEDLTPEGNSEDGVVNGEVEDYQVILKRPQPTKDFGDAPDPYPTLIADNGAQHLHDPGVLFGDRVDAEPNGQPTANADGDDIADQDDDDGIRFLNDLRPGGDGRVEITTPNGGWVNAWIDFDGNGVWDPAPSPEAVVVARLLQPGATVVTFPIPEDAKVDPENPTFSRWRITTDISLLTPTGGGPAGLIPNGEVEDHPVFIIDPTLRGDFNKDGKVDDADIDAICKNLGAMGHITDLNGDGVTDLKDLDTLVHDVLKTVYGDVNLDGRFNPTDLVQLFSAGKYSARIPATWADGDFNCDGFVDSNDLIRAFIDGGYSANARADLAAAVDGFLLDVLDDDEESDIIAKSM